MRASVGLSDDGRYEAFAVDAEHGLAFLIEAEPPELARATLEVVLTGVTTS